MGQCVEGLEAGAAGGTGGTSPGGMVCSLIRVGTFAVPMAKACGAEVTAVCSTRKVALARSIGTDQVIAGTQEDVTRNVYMWELRERIFDTSVTALLSL
jgi:D-arabinose 1-dehydrogenase-like Zn-dependent alcohol dehydrogenase